MDYHRALPTTFVGVFSSARVLIARRQAKELKTKLHGTRKRSEARSLQKPSKTMDVIQPCQAEAGDCHVLRSIAGGISEVFTECCRRWCNGRLRKVTGSSAVVGGGCCEARQGGAFSCPQYGICGSDSLVFVQGVAERDAAGQADSLPSSCLADMSECCPKESMFAVGKQASCERSRVKGLSFQIEKFCFGRHGCVPVLDA